MVTVPIGKSEDVRTDTSFVDVIVGDPEVADVNPLTDHALSILGKKIGTTRVSVYAEGKKLIGIFDVEVSYDITRLTNELRRRFPGSQIKASTVNGRIMLSGEVADAATLDKAVTIARQFGPEIINTCLGDVAAAGDAGGALHRDFAHGGPRAGRAVELGSAATASQRRQPRECRTICRSAATIDRCRDRGRRDLRRLAVRLPDRPHRGERRQDRRADQRTRSRRALPAAWPSRICVALSGDTASFLAGGEYPIPVSGSFGQVTVDYKKYGVGLAFTPTVLGRGLINMKIEPEVSQIDTTHTVSVSNGVSVPALIVRRASTTVELRDGQSFVIGGLLQSDNKNAIEQLPWLGSVPVLGALFSSKSYQKNETDLAIIVTPRLVRPARPGDEVKAPTDDTLPPNDVDFFLLGKNRGHARTGAAS